MHTLRHLVPPPLAKALVLGLLLLGGSWGRTQSISYTVQVAALSSQGSAEGLRRTLREAGYPAYLVSVPGDAQTVYRLRVGAFANREAAQAYASAMRGVGGTVPVPALAEGIPPDLIPLEPNFIAAYPLQGGRLEVVPWGEATALRVQPFVQDRPQIASYRILARAGVSAGLSFEAWRAAPLTGEDGVLERVTDLLLDTPARLADVAEGLGLTPEQIEPYVFGAESEPYLVVAERFDPVSGTGARYPALGNPASQGTRPAGPELIWFGQAAPENFPGSLPEPLFLLQNLFRDGKLAPPENEVTGNGWSARADGRFTTVVLDNRTWRALVGRPLWAGGDFLLVLANREVALYEMTRP